jgi:hypothetical protein
MYDEINKFHDRRQSMIENLSKIYRSTIEKQAQTASPQAPELQRQAEALAETDITACEEASFPQTYPQLGDPAQLESILAEIAAEIRGTQKASSDADQTALDETTHEVAAKEFDDPGGQRTRSS